MRPYFPRILELSKTARAVKMRGQHLLLVFPGGVAGHRVQDNQDDRGIIYMYSICTELLALLRRHIVRKFIQRRLS